MLLKTDGIDVNKEVRIIILTPYPYLVFLFILLPLPLLFSLLQGENSTPLYWASRNGHTDIVALLLQAEGIDVNKGVMPKYLPLPSLGSPHFTTTNPFHSLPFFPPFHSF